MNKLVKINGGELKPYFEKSRPACPFYGFHINFEIMVDQKGNECALIKGYTPCQMKIRKLTPCWNNCSFYSPEDIKNLKEMEEILAVFPDEFHPPKARSWKGITLKQWIQYIESRKSS